MVRRNQFSTWHFSGVVTNEALIERVLAEGLVIWVQAPYWPLGGRANSTDFEARLRERVPNNCFSEDTYLLGWCATPATFSPSIPRYCAVASPMNHLQSISDHHHKGFPSRTDTLRTPQCASRMVRVHCDILSQIDRVK